MKKPFLISTSFLTILASIGSGINVSATEIINGRQWWTMDELRPIISEMEFEAETECKDDYKCRKSFYKKMIASNTERSIANVFSGFEFMISDIMPAEQRIRFLFQGRPRLQYRNADSQHYIDKVYIGWLNEEDWDTIGGNYDDLLASFNGGAGKDSMHCLFFGSAEEGNVPEPDGYIDMVLGEDFDRINGRIYYILQYQDGEGNWGSFEFKYFQNGGDFEKDKEYELKFGGTATFGFLEKNNKIVEDEDVETVNDTNEYVEEEIETIDEEDDDMKGKGDIEENKENGKGTIVREILAPDTGIVKK